MNHFNRHCLGSTNECCIYPINGYTPCFMMNKPYPNICYRKLPSMMGYQDMRADQGLPEEKLIPVIIETKSKPLMRQYPNIPKKFWGELKSHPYFMQLQQKYNTWIQQIKQIAPNLKVDNTFGTLFSGMAVTLPEAVIRRVEKLPFVKGIYRDEEVMISGSRDGDDTTISSVPTRNLKLVNVPPVHRMKDNRDKLINGRGVRIAIIDGAWDLNETFLKGKIVDSYDFVNRTENISDLAPSHSYIVAKIILDVAPKAGILAYKTKTTADNIAAIERAVHHKADVINLSRGGLYKSKDRDVIGEVVKNGVVVVNATGNYRAGEESSEVEIIVKTSPLAILVGATTDDGTEVADYSSYGPFNKGEIKPDLVAPGTYPLDILSDQFFQRGTSYAAPYVAGVAALMRQKYPNQNMEDIKYWSAEDIKSAVATTATLLEDDGKIPFFAQGSGRLDAFRAINTNTVISPIHISFGIGEQIGEQEQQVLTIKNKSDVPMEYQLKWGWKQDEEWRWDGITDELEGRLSEYSIVVPPGETKQITLFLTIKPTVDKMGYPGLIGITSGLEEWHVPVWVNIHPFLFDW